MAKETRLWIVMDGEKHWVVAATEQEAIDAVRDAFDHGDEYEAEYEPTAGWAPMNEPVRFNVTDAVGCVANDYPPGTQFYCDAMPFNIVRHMSGVVCSTVW